MDETQKMYEEYRKKFATAHNLTIAEATERKMVSLYKEWLEDKYKVVIDEKR